MGGTIRNRNYIQSFVFLALIFVFVLGLVSALSLSTCPGDINSDYFSQTLTMSQNFNGWSGTCFNLTNNLLSDSGLESWSYTYSPNYWWLWSHVSRSTDSNEGAYSLDFDGNSTNYAGVAQSLKFAVPGTTYRNSLKSKGDGNIGLVYL